MKKQSRLITNNISLVIILIILGLTQRTFGQEENEKAIKLSGSVDTYFRHNLNAINSIVLAEETLFISPKSAFANQPGFAIGMANLVLEHEGKNTGVVVDLAFGPRGSDAVFKSTTSSSSIINQLYVYWNVSEKTKLTLGNFNTFLGYEMISPTANFNYSTSYMFSNGPFSHDGLKADFTLGETSLILAIMNPTDDTDFNPTGNFVLGTQLGYKGGFLNFIYDDANNRFYQIDFTGGWDLSDAFYLGVNATKAKDSFAGAAIYLKRSVTENMSIGLRGEYFKDNGLGLLTKGGNIIDLTLSANYTLGNLTVIPEVRIDKASIDSDKFLTAGEQSFDNSGIPNEGLINTKYNKNLSSFVLAAVYSF